MIDTIALDLEGTLISNAISQIPRPGLYEFLQACDNRFSRIVIYTAVNEFVFREIAKTLVAKKNAPSWFIELEYVEWQGKYKDLSFISNVELDRIAIVDDREEYIKPNQKDRWLSIPGYDYPYSSDDRELYFLMLRLSECLKDK